VAANIYNATFLKIVGHFTYSMLDIVPKDKTGAPIEKLSSALVDADKSQPGIQELKEWQGIIEYVQSFKETHSNGVAQLPEKYKGTLGRIVVLPSWNPAKLLSHPTLPTILTLVLAGVIFCVIIIMITLAMSSKKRKRRRRMSQVIL
jgi:hypothetical protein